MHKRPMAAAATNGEWFDFYLLHGYKEAAANASILPQLHDPVSLSQKFQEGKSGLWMAY